MTVLALNFSELNTATVSGVPGVAQPIPLLPALAVAVLALLVMFR